MNVFNKVLVCGSVAAVLAFSVSTVQAQNLLVNGSFENSSQFNAGNPIPLAGVGLGWASNFGGAAPVQSDMTSSPDSPLDGNFALLAQNAPGNAWNPQGDYQIIANSSVGSTWSASIWALTDTGVLGAATAGTGPVDFQIQFLDSNFTNNLSTVETGWSAIDKNDTWQQYSVSGVVPAGTAYIAVYAMAMIGPGATGPVNVYFDNGNLSVAPAPEPTTLALAGLGGAAALSLIRRRKS
jgi:PEP-CTERM motif